MLKDLFLPHILLLLILFKLVIYYLISLRWRRILAELSIKATTGQAMSFSFLAIFFAYFLPGNMSSDVAKSFFASRVFGSLGRVVFAIIIDRLIGLFSLIFLLLIGVGVFSFNQSPQFLRLWGVLSQIPWWYFLLAIIIGLISAVVLLNIIKKHHKFKELKKIIFELKSIKFWVYVTFLSLLSHFVFALFLSSTAQTLHLNGIDLLGCLIIFPLSTLAMIIPLTPGSLGVGQVLYQYLFDLYAGEPTQAALLFTSLQVMDIPFMIYGAWYFTRLLKLKK